MSKKRKRVKGTADYTHLLAAKAKADATATQSFEEVLEDCKCFPRRPRIKLSNYSVWGAILSKILAPKASDETCQGSGEGAA